MDLENDMLYGKWCRPTPTGVGRANYTDWTDLIRENIDVCVTNTVGFRRRTEAKLAEHLESGSDSICVIYDHEQELDKKMAKYIAWVKAGGGDEDFQDRE